MYLAHNQQTLWSLLLLQPQLQKLKSETYIEKHFLDTFDNLAQHK